MNEFFNPSEEKQFDVKNDPYGLRGSDPIKFVVKDVQSFNLPSVLEEITIKVVTGIVKRFGDKP